MALKGMTGTGFTSLSLNPTTTQVVTFTSPFNGFNLSRDDTEEEALGWPVSNEQGSAQTLYSVITQQTWELNLTFQAFDWGVLQLSFGQHEATTTSIKLAQGKTGVVPDAPGPYVFTDTDLNGLAVADLTVSFLASETQPFTPLEVLDTGTPAVGEVTLDDTANTLTFAAANAGKSFAYYPKLTYANKKTLGVEDAAVALNSVSFDGAIVLASKPQKILVNIPAMSRTGGLSFEVGGTENEVVFRPVISGSNSSPIRFLNPD